MSRRSKQSASNRCLNILLLSSDIITSTCFFGFFCAQLADSNLRAPSSIGFNEGWKYIGYITASIFCIALILHFVAINLTKEEVKPHELVSSIVRKPLWSSYTKAFALLSLTASVLLLYVRWEKQFPLLFAVGLFLLMVSNFFPEKNIRSPRSHRLCSPYCHYDFLLGLFFLPQIFAVAVLYINVNGFANLPKAFFFATSVVGLGFSVILITAMTFKTPHYELRSPRINISLSRITEASRETTQNDTISLLN
jgi:lipid-A-disaccharide synthase-like uncharacterized protein